MTTITEIAPDIFRISTYDSNADLQFVQFLVRDEAPLLFHTGLRAMFPTVRDAVAKLIEPETLRWISFSHFEADECGSLNEWLHLAPHAQAACSALGAAVSVNDFAIRPARSLQHHEVLKTGKYQFQFHYTPHVPHGWDAGLLFETTHRTLFCSDLLHQFGDVEAFTSSEAIDRVRKTVEAYKNNPIPNPIPWTTHTEQTLQELANLCPRTLATMHGSTIIGDGRQAIRDLSSMMREEFEPQMAASIPYATSHGY